MNLARTSRDPGGLRILVVDGNTDSALTLVMVIRMRRHEAHVAFDGPTALRRAREVNPDVVLLDLGLPLMHGHDVARQIKGDPSAKAPFIIAVTGRGSPEDRRRSLEAGVDLHLIKPVDPDYLLRVLERFSRVLQATP